MTLVSQKIRNSARGASCAGCNSNDETVTWRHAPSISKLTATRGLKPIGCKGSQKSNDNWGAPLCHRCDSMLQEGDWQRNFTTREHYYAHWFHIIDRAQNSNDGLVAQGILTA